MVYASDFLWWILEKSKRRLNPSIRVSQLSGEQAATLSAGELLTLRMESSDWLLLMGR